MSGIDYLFLIVLGLSALNGLRIGLIRQCAGLLGTLLGFTAAFYYYDKVAAGLNKYAHLGAYLQQALAGGEKALPGLSGIVLNIISLLAVYAAVNLVVIWAGNMVGGLVRAVHLTAFDRIAGSGLGLVKGLIIISLGLRLINLLALPEVEAQVARSRLAGTVAAVTEKMFREVENLIPGKTVPPPGEKATQSI